MITREQLVTALGEDKKPFKTRGVDHTLVALNILRSKIPYEICGSIIGCAEHDIIYLVDVEEALPYLDEADLMQLADCNCGIDEDLDSIFKFV